MNKHTLLFFLTCLFVFPVIAEEPDAQDRTDGSRRDADFQRFPSEPGSEAPAALIQALHRARELSTHDKPRWRKLLHYEPTMMGGWKSEADAYEFFFSDEGKVNPEAELRSTVVAFFMARPEDPQKHPICHFPARLLWLSQELGISSSDLPEVQCTNLQTWLGLTNSRSISVIFATYYGSNPASMYGHTFLKLNSRKEDPLLDYAIDYAATTGDVDPVRYALYGLMGGFPGFFSMMPYHMKVHEYSDLESRDLWEYELDLTDEERRFMLLHAWELGGIYFDYYYLTENCSYHILSLIEVARPEISLKNQFSGWVLPAETVKLLFHNEGLLKDVMYRPSLYNEIQTRLEQIRPEQRESFKELLQSDSLERDEQILGDYSKYEQAEILDATLQTYLYYKRKDDLDESRKASFQRLIRRRSGLPGFRTDPLPQVRNTPPEAGHGPMNIRLGAGSMSVDSLNGDQVQRGFASLFFRPVLHDYLGPQEGYEPYSVFEFLSGEVRIFDGDDSQVDGQRIELEEFHLLRVESYSPVDLVRSPFSYSVDFGLEQEQYRTTGMPASLDLNSTEDVLLLNQDPAGYAIYSLMQDSLLQRTNPFARVLLGYTFRDQYGDIHPYLQNMIFSFMGGATAEGGAPGDSSARLGPMARVLIQGQYGFLRLGLEGVHRGLDGGRTAVYFSGGYSFGREHELRWRVGAEDWKEEFSVGYSYYF